MASKNSRNPQRASAHGDADTRVAHLVRDVGAADVDPNHHLWRNGRLWWIAFTVHYGHRQERLRFSLGTADVALARRRRDEVLRTYEEAEDCKVAIRIRQRVFPAAGCEVRA